MRKIISIIAVCIISSSYASIVYLPSNAVNVGGTPDQSFYLHSALGRGLYDAGLSPVTIISGSTSLEDALTYLARPQSSAGDMYTNGRFNGSFGSVRYTMDSVDIDGLLFWNYSESIGTDYNERGLLSADIAVTHDGGTTLIPGVAFSLTPETAGTDYSIAQQISFGSTYSGVTEVEFSNLSSGTSQFAGWQQVASYQIPEPNTLVLLGAAGGTLHFIRRRIRR